MITETFQWCLLVQKVNCAHGTRQYHLAQFTFSITAGVARSHLLVCFHTYVSRPAIRKEKKADLMTRLVVLFLSAILTCKFVLFNKIL